MSTLEIKGLQVQVETNEGPKQILKGVDLTINSGEIHAIMGPNGSGKSTLAYSLAGHPKYEVTGGQALLDGEDLLQMTADERARAGLFLAMQYPVEVRQWVKDVKDAMTRLRMDPDMANRDLNHGFSGGEKKRNEILQLELLRPRFAVLDETDSGLDVDALRIVSEGVNRVHESTGLGVMLITHYTRILNYIKPDFVHVFVDGHVVEQGGPELADRLEAEGYDRYLVSK